MCFDVLFHSRFITTPIKVLDLPFWGFQPPFFTFFPKKTISRTKKYVEEKVINLRNLIWDDLLVLEHIDQRKEMYKWTLTWPSRSYTHLWCAVLLWNLYFHAKKHGEIRHCATESYYPTYIFIGSFIITTLLPDYFILRPYSPRRFYSQWEQRVRHPALPTPSRAHHAPLPARPWPP